MASAYRRHRRIKWFKDAVLTVCFLFLLVLIAARLQGTTSNPVSGPFRVVDGDTLAAGGERLRLAGIDAPELDQTCERGNESWACGEEAKAALERLSGRGAIECLGSEKDRYGRLVVSCRMGNTNVNGFMVRSGMAVTTGLITFRKEQMRAQDRKLGLWAGSFEMPAQWRKRRRLEADDGSLLDGLKDVLSLDWL